MILFEDESKNKLNTSLCMIPLIKRKEKERLTLSLSGCHYFGLILP